MRISKILAVGLVIVFGVVAASLAQTWFERQASLATRRPDPAPVATKTIVVAVQPLRFGTELMAEHLQEISWPAGSTPSGSFEKVSDLLTAQGRRVVLSPIEPSEPVLSWKVTGPGERATLSAVVEEGMRAMSVRINDVLGVAGFVLPGDRVDIMITRDNFTDILLQNVKILAIDRTADERTDKPKTGKTVTFEVNTIEAQKLTLAQTVGSLSLALRVEGGDDLGPAFKNYAGEQEGKSEEEKAIDLLAKKVESGFRDMESKINRVGEEFKQKTQPLKTQAVPFDPNARRNFRNNLSAVVENGRRAMAVRINDVGGVAGFVLPGDRVNIMMSRSGFTHILLRNVKILAIDQIADERTDKPKAGKIVTLEVNSIDTQKLTLAQTVGSLSLALWAAGEVGAAAPRRARGDFPNDPFKCEFSYGPCIEPLEPAG